MNLKQFFRWRRRLRKHWLGYYIGDSLLAKDMWLPRRESMARGFFIGSMSGASPFFGFQIAMSLPFCIWLRANIPMTLFMVFMSNPFTAIPYYLFTIWLGNAVMLGTWMVPWPDVPQDLDALKDIVLEHFLAAFVGCTIIGLVVGGTGYVLMHLLWKEPGGNDPTRGVARTGEAGAAESATEIREVDDRSPNEEIDSPDPDRSRSDARLTQPMAVSA